MIYLYTYIKSILSEFFLLANINRSHIFFQLIEFSPFLHVLKTAFKQKMGITSYFEFVFFILSSKTWVPRLEWYLTHSDRKMVMLYPVWSEGNKLDQNLNLVRLFPADNHCTTSIYIKYILLRMKRQSSLFQNASSRS